MPCKSDYMAPDDKERELQRTAKLLIYVQEQIGQAHEAWTLAAANNMYPNDDRVVIQLCNVLNELDSEQRERIVYNAHDKTARDLADWWEEHQNADAERLRQADAEIAQGRLREQALSKLTDEEKRALGLNG